MRPPQPGLKLWHLLYALDRMHDRPASSIGFDRRLDFRRAERRDVARTLLGRGRHCYPASPELAWLVPRLVGEVARGPGLGAAGMIASLAKAALIELARCVETGAVHDRPRGAERRVAAFLEALPRRCHEPWTLIRMARACELGRSRFAELVREQTGDSPIMALNRVRVQRAKHMIRTTDTPITEIAFACGFTSSQYFARVFREYTGSAASELR